MKLRIKEVEAILTPDQFIKFKEMKDSSQEHRKEKRGEH